MPVNEVIESTRKIKKSVNFEFLNCIEAEVRKLEVGTKKI